jgi:deoxycytidylate deaminase
MITAKDRRWIDLAKKIARTSNHDKYHMSALLVSGGRVISLGVNKLSGPKRFTKQRPGMRLHAEIDCLLNIGKDVSKGSTLYITGYTKAGNDLKSSAPCLSCAAFVDEMMIKRIVYTEYGQIKELR